MAFTSARPITVDGVRLDTLAWNIEKIERATAARRSGDYDIPNLDGVVASLNDSLEPTRLGLQMWLRGTDADGAVPAGGDTLTKLRDNLDELLHLFGKRHALLEVQEQVGAGTLATNLAANPSLETVVTNWSVTTAQFTGARTSSADAASGGWVYRATCNAATTTAGLVVQSHISTQRARANPGELVGIRVRARASAPKTVSMRARAYNGTTAATSAGFSTKVITVGTEWEEFTVSGLLPAAQDGFSLTGYVATPAEWAVGDWIEWDALQMWVGEDPGPASYFDGSTPTDGLYSYSWTGTAHNSASVRTPRSTRRALAKVTDSIQPELNTPGSAGTFTVAMVIPSGTWEDAVATDTVLTAPVTAAEVTGLTGATERISDAIFYVKGPATTPRITDPATGMWVELGASLTSAQGWWFDSSTWASRYGAPVLTAGLNSTPATGTDAASITSVGGPARAYVLPLTPIRDSGLRMVRATLTAASGIVTGTTQLSIRGRRKYA